MYTEEEYQQALSRKDNIIDMKASAIADKDARIALFEELLAIQKSNRFGASSEKISGTARDV
jgi:hypothetical protein